MTRALFQQALSLSGYYESTWVGDLGDLEKLVQAAVSAHLAQPRGEPVAEVCDTEYSLDDDGNKVLHALVYEFGRLTIGDKLFTHPAHTEADVTLILDAFDNIELRRDLAREIRRILGVMP